MNIVSFLFLLSAFSAVTALTVEAIKKFIVDVENRSYNIIALVVALIVGVVGTLLYYLLTNTPLTMINLIFAVLMGFASALVAMMGYDRVMQTIEQFKRQ